MNEIYKPNEIEPKWQKKWAEDKTYKAVIDDSKPKYYALTMLPYPSGDLHIGHWFAMTPSDAHARFVRMQGYNVMFPIGFDAFGLPAENAAIKNNIHPKVWTYKNIENMRGQLKSMGAMFDWDREAISSDPEYYHWTQWFFLKLYHNDLAYRKYQAVDWCPSCNTTLAREQVKGDNRECERCHTPVIKKELEQWFFKTTKYAEELLNFGEIDWPERVKLLQTNWIHRSEGASVIFHTEVGEEIEVFTTRPDTLWGATFMVLAPEHPLVEKVCSTEHRGKLDDYIEQASRQSNIERESLTREKTGVFTGGYAVNPVNDEKVPIWVADYVVMTYGTGAIMAVPAHDQRDFEFARKYDIEVRVVIKPEDVEMDGATMEESWPGEGVMVNSDQFNGTPATNEKGRKNPAISKVIDWIEKEGIGKEDINYRLRDWLISRQRYWGTPIPMIHCEKCGIVPEKEENLPVLLPDDIEWRPTGESPLKFHESWKNVSCPKCGGEAVRDTDTMDTFMCSSWYHLRYLSPDFHEGPFDPAEYDYWMPVDTYTGGIEHANMHLIYTRFFHKALRDMGIVEGHEPMTQLRNQGLVLGSDMEKMSKSRGNVMAPDLLVEKYGADIVRAYLMFFTRWNQGGPWDSKGIEGTARWMRRVWTAFTTDPGVNRKAEAEDLKALRLKTHLTLESATHDYRAFEFNTIISGLMELMNEIYRLRKLGVYGTEEWKESVSIYLRILAPIAPHIAEELWTKNGGKYSIHSQSWPELDRSAIIMDEITLVVQVNGKLRDKIQALADISDEDAKALALASETVQKFMEGKEPRKVIVIKGRLVNIVV